MVVPSLLALILMTSCADPTFKPTPEELQARDYFANQIVPSQREEVMRKALRQTNWSEKRQVQWETKQYQHIVEEAQKRMHKILTGPTSQPALGY